MYTRRDDRIFQQKLANNTRVQQYERDFLSYPRDQLVEIYRMPMVIYGPYGFSAEATPCDALLRAAAAYRRLQVNFADDAKLEKFLRTFKPQ
jgi:hypothetical protein